MINIVLKKLYGKRETSNIAFFSFGMLVSLFGTSIYTFAMGLHVLKITASGLSFAATLALGTIPMVIANPFAGVLADRLNKKMLAVAMDILNGLLLAALYILSEAYGLRLIMIYAATLLLTIFSTVYNISMDAAKPNMVSDEKLLSINSVSKIIDAASSIMGPMVGGMIFAFIDIRLFIIINSISFFISGICGMLMDFKYNCKESEEVKNELDFIKDIADGAKYLKKKKGVTNLFVILIALNFFLALSVSVPLPFIINNVLKLKSNYYGIIQGAFPVGMIIGAAAVKKISEKFSYNRLLLSTSFILSACLAMIGFPVILGFGNITNLIYYLSVMIVFGIMISFIDIPLMYMLQIIIPEEYRGRVLSIGISLGKIIAPLGLIISGALINLLPAYILPLTGGILLLICNMLLAKGKGMNELSF